MADSNHLRVFHRGVGAWNRWRRKHRRVQPDLSHADLRQSSLRLGNLNHANLRYANLEGANLGRAYLEAADLEGAQQRGAHLFGADLGRADLRNADLAEAQLWQVRLEEADLRNANLREADLRDSDLTKANLGGANLGNANLEKARLSRSDFSGACLDGVRFHQARLWECRFDDASWAGATLGHTVLSHLDLSRIAGLETVKHDEPSSIGIDTLESTAAGLAQDPSRQGEVEAFLRAAGVREKYLEIFRQRIEISFGFYAAFIRHSHADREFARLLYDTLQQRGVRCWLHEHPMLPGNDAHEALDVGPWDRSLLLLSEAACSSWWIESEVMHALDQEKGSGVTIPVCTDEYPASGRWQSPAAEHVLGRQVADFRGWQQDSTVFEREINKIVEALRVVPT